MDKKAEKARQPTLDIQTALPVQYEDSTVHRLAIHNTGMLGAESCQCRLALDIVAEDVEIDKIPAITTTKPYRPPEEMNLYWSPRNPNSLEIPIMGKSSEIVEVVRVTKPYRELVGDPMRLAIRDMLGARDDDSDYVTRPATFEIPSHPVRLTLKARNYEGSIKVQSMNCEPVTRPLKIKFNGKDDIALELK